MVTNREDNATTLPDYVKRVKDATAVVSLCLIMFSDKDLELTIADAVHEQKKYEAIGFADDAPAVYGAKIHFNENTVAYLEALKAVRGAAADLKRSSDMLLAAADRCGVKVTP